MEKEGEHELGSPDDHVIRPATPTLFGRLGGLGEAVVELIVDRDLRRQVNVPS